MANRLLAYNAQNYEHGCVVFAENRGKARADACGRLECEWLDIETCRRAPEFDSYSPGPVPVKVLLESGWHWECGGCSLQVYDEPGLVWLEEQPFHSEECKAKYERILAEVKESNERRNAEREAWIESARKQATDGQ